MYMYKTSNTQAGTYLHVPRGHGPHPLRQHSRQVHALRPRQAPFSSSSSMNDHVQQRLQQVLLQRGVAERGGQEVPPRTGPEAADTGVRAEEAGVEEVRLWDCGVVWLMA